MRPASAHILPLLLALSCLLAGCARGRVIPEEKLTRIFEDMLLADQWIRENPDARKAADTTLFYDPIFKRHGYTFKDYDRSVNYYLDRPEEFAKILNNASERLNKESDRLQILLDERLAAGQEKDRLHRLYKTDWDFTDDSLRWTRDRILWPVRDSLARPDSTAVADSLARRDSLSLVDSVLKPVGRRLDSLIIPERKTITK